MNRGLFPSDAKYLKEQVLQPQALRLIPLLWASCTALRLLATSEGLVQERYMAPVLIPAARPFSQTLSSAALSGFLKKDPSEVHFTSLRVLDLDPLLQPEARQWDHGAAWLYAVVWDECSILGEGC